MKDRVIEPDPMPVLESDPVVVLEPDPNVTVEPESMAEADPSVSEQPPIKAYLVPNRHDRRRQAAIARREKRAGK